jgi:hypothetical protein
VIAAAGVDAVIRRDDALKEQILRPMFCDEWPQQRMFPNRAVSDGATLEFGGASFTVIDLGPSESPHDSIWLHGCRARGTLRRRRHPRQWRERRCRWSAGHERAEGANGAARSDVVARYGDDIRSAGRPGDRATSCSTAYARSWEGEAPLSLDDALADELQLDEPA